MKMGYVHNVIIYKNYIGHFGFDIYFIKSVAQYNYTGQASF